MTEITVRLKETTSVFNEELQNWRYVYKAGSRGTIIGHTYNSKSSEQITVILTYNPEGNPEIVYVTPKDYEIIDVSIK